MTPFAPILAWQSPISLEYLNWLQAACLFAGVALPIVLLGMRSLNGLGPVRKWVAIGIRLLVVALFVLVIGGARWQRQNKNLEVIVLRDVSESTAQVLDFPGKTLQESIDQWLRDLSDDKNGKPREDRLGVISFQEQALIDAMPSIRPALDARPIRETGGGTNIASAIQLALATFSRDAMHRILLISDGNPTTGDLEAAIAAAQAAGVEVQIDVAPLRYDVKNEIVVERLNAPAMKRENEPFTIDVVLRSTNPGRVNGKLTILHSGQPMDMDPYTEGLQATRVISVKPGPNTERVRVPALVGGSTIHDFEAVFEAEGFAGATTQPGALANSGVPASAGTGAKATAQPSRGDTLVANNTAKAFTFIKGKGRVLYVDNVEGGRGEILDKALKAEGLNSERVGVDQFPGSLVELQNYDGIVLANVPRGAEGMSDDQQKMLATYVHDLGGGLVMIGGPDAFGAGGWQGSKLEEVLPVNMDIPAQRQLPKGALVLVMHSCEMPEGNYWGEQCALQASKTLSERDEIGVISYDWGGGGSNWDFPLQVKGDGSRVEAAIKRMQLGDMPSFDDTLDLALNGKNGVGGLLRSDSRQKHVIVIS
ncbi:MAG: VWA domain-containing protein, partial [Tepidisphaeraceae bacterium]